MGSFWVQLQTCGTFHNPKEMTQQSEVIPFFIIAWFNFILIISQHLYLSALSGPEGPLVVCGFVGCVGSTKSSFYLTPQFINRVQPNGRLQKLGLFFLHAQLNPLLTPLSRSRKFRCTAVRRHCTDWYEI